MAGHHHSYINTNSKKAQCRKNSNAKKMNLQHSRLATDKIIKIIEEVNIDILCIQDPYEIRNKIAGMPSRLNIYTAGKGKHRAAIVANNNQQDIILIKQLHTRTR